MTLMCSSCTRSAYLPAAVTIAISADSASGVPCAARQADHLHSALTRRLDRGEHVLARAAGRNREQHVAGTPVRFDEAREHLLVAVVVADARQVTGIADRHRRISGPVIAEAAGQLFGEMHRVAHRAAVAARVGAATSGKSICQQMPAAAICCSIASLPSSACKAPSASFNVFLTAPIVMPRRSRLRSAEGAAPPSSRRTDRTGRRCRADPDSLQDGPENRTPAHR